MARKAQIPVCSEDDRRTLSNWANSRSIEWRLVERARMIAQLLDGVPIKKIAQAMGTGENTLIKWRNRFAAQGIKGLHDQPRSGKPAKYDKEFRNRILQTLELPPPKGQSCWDGPAIARHLQASDDAVWRVLRKEGICLARQRRWRISTDPEIAPKTVDIIGLYLAPPQNALVMSVDEKTSVQALEWATGYVCTSSNKILRGLKSTYKRNGTLNLFSALNVATGSDYALTPEYKRRFEFLAFMDQLLAELPDGNEKEIHVILDNYYIHKRNDKWLADHPHVIFHVTPNSASWLNQVEIWFGILSSKVIKNSSVTSTDQLRSAIESFIEVYRQKAKPFVWRKGQAKEPQLRNTATNNCN